MEKAVSPGPQDVVRAEKMLELYEGEEEPDRVVVLDPRDAGGRKRHPKSQGPYGPGRHHEADAHAKALRSGYGREDLKHDIRHATRRADSLDQSLFRPRVYRDRPTLSAVIALLEVDLDQDGIRDAVRVDHAKVRGADGLRGIDELTVDWAAVTAPGRAHGPLLLAGIARSILEGEPVSLAAVDTLSREHAGSIAAAFALIARPQPSR